jgi:hypothetical protein
VAKLACVFLHAKLDVKVRIYMERIGTPVLKPAPSKYPADLAQDIYGGRVPKK